MNLKERIIVVGANHAGTSFIRTLATINKKAEIVVYDQNTNISYLGCGTALWIGGEFDDPAGLFYSSKEQLTKMGAKVFMNHKVTEIDSKTKTIKVVDQSSEMHNEFSDKYDKLIFAAGTWPIVPPFDGVNLENIYLAKLFQHAELIKKAAMDEAVQNVVIIGAGYIGVELVEALNKYGKSVTLIDMMDRVIPNYFDADFTDEMESRMKKGINDIKVKLALNQKVVKFKGKDNKVSAVVTNKGEYKADLVIMSIGFVPQTKMLKGQVEMIPNGAIKVNEYQLTSNEDIYAIGDSCAVFHNVFQSNQNVALATNAVKTGIVAAMHITNGSGIEFPGVQGTNSISVYGCHYSSTGLSEESLKRFKMPYKSEILEDNDRPEFMKVYGKVRIKITYEPDSLKLLGAQLGTWDEFNHSDAIYVLSLAIAKGMTLPEIALMDFFFLPHFNKPFNYIIQVMLNALGLKY